MNVKDQLKRSRALAIAGGLALDGRARVRTAFGRSETHTEGQSTSQDPAAAVAYVQRSFAGLSAYGIDAERLKGANVLELGPGDNLGLALRMLAAGARSVVAVDRFAFPHDAVHQSAIYRRLVDELGDPPDLRDVIEFRDGVAVLNPQRVQVAIVGIENAPAQLGERTFDLITSVAVGEHLQEPDSSYAAMAQLLRPGGEMLHVIDFRDHGMFTGGGQHPLEFLTVSDRVYRFMASARGGPNRRLIDYYRGILPRLGFDTDIWVTQVAGRPVDLDPYPAQLVRGEHFGPDEVALIERIRPRLLPRFRALAVEDLLAAGVLVRARKTVG